MTKKNTNPRRPPIFNLGSEQAEDDPLLNNSFYQSTQYESIVSKDDPHCFLIGRTGSGKSAMLNQLEEDNKEHTIRINPDDLSLPYITNSRILQYLDSIDVHLDPLFIALWKHVILVEVIRHRYKVDSPTAKQNWMSGLREKIRRDSSKLAALEYLDQFEGKFWCETDERVRDITESFEKQIASTAEFGASAGPLNLKAGASDDLRERQEIREQSKDKFQRIVYDTQLARLNKMLKVLDEDILSSTQNYTYIVIDDLDLNWVDERVLNSLIRCLFRAVMDMKRVQNLKILVALRTNIFEQLDFSAQSGQEEKFRSNSLTVRWSKEDLRRLIDARIESGAKRSRIEGVRSIKDLLPGTNNTRGNAFNFILRHTLMRPRDLISYMNQCLESNGGKPRITWNSINEALPLYSKNRLLALRDEWKVSFPGIEIVLRKFASLPDTMPPERAYACLDEVMTLAGDPKFPGVGWVGRLSEEFYNSTEDAGLDNAQIYHPLIRLLFDIGFLGYSRDGTSETLYSHQHPGDADSLTNIREISTFHVHPAFRSTLDIRPGKSYELNQHTS